MPPRGRPRQKRPAPRQPEMRATRSRPNHEPQLQETWWEAETVVDEPTPGTSGSQNPPRHTTQANSTGPGWEIFAQLNERIIELEQLKRMKGDMIDDLDLTVKQETKEKIWADNFVNLGDLLDRQSGADDSDNIQLVKDNQGALSVKQTKAKKSPLSIEQWSSAFMVFMSVYIRRHPQVVQGLLAYGQLIRNAAKDNPGSVGWRQYDEEFRRKKAADPKRPWGMIDTQLWLTTVGKVGAAPEKSASQTQMLQKACFAFNTEKGCERVNCKFKHSCSNCARTNHGAHRCWAKKAETKPNSKPSNDSEENAKGSMNNPFRFGGKQ